MNAAAHHLVSVPRQLKNHLIPQGSHMRAVRFGLARGARVPMDLSRHTRLYFGLYEIELTRHLRAFCTPGLRSFDVGAQIGYDALVLARLTSAPVMSFDADDALARSLAVTFAANGTLGGLITARHATISHLSGPRCALALDDVAFEEGFVPGVMKIDIDGGEVEALWGARRILREVRPHLIVETHSVSLERECGRLMIDAGYRPTIVNQRLLWPDYRPTAHNRWLVAEGAPHKSALANSS